MKNKSLYFSNSETLSGSITLSNGKLKLNKKVVKSLYLYCINDSKRIKNLPFLFEMFDFLLNKKNFSILKLKDRYFLESLIINDLKTFYLLVSILNRKKKIFYVVNTKERESFI